MIEDLNALEKACPNLRIQAETGFLPSIIDNFKGHARFMSTAEIYVEKDWDFVMEALENSKNLVELEILDFVHGEERTGTFTFTNKMFHLKDLKINVPLTKAQFVALDLSNQGPNLENVQLTFAMNSIDNVEMLSSLPSSHLESLEIAEVIGQSAADTDDNSNRSLIFAEFRNCFPSTINW